MSCTAPDIACPPSRVEYACRSGTITSRYHGLSTDLLGKHAWYQSNSRTRPFCGSLLPNEFGLFDMLGNVFSGPGSIRRPEQANDDITIQEIANITSPRLLWRVVRILRRASLGLRD